MTWVYCEPKSRIRIREEGCAFTASVGSAPFPGDSRRDRYSDRLDRSVLRRKNRAGIARALPRPAAYSPRIHRATARWQKQRRREDVSSLMVRASCNNATVTIGDGRLPIDGSGGD